MSMVNKSATTDTSASISESQIVVWLSPAKSLSCGDDSWLSGFIVIPNLSMLAPATLVLTLLAVVWVVFLFIFHFKYFIISLGSGLHCGFLCHGSRHNIILFKVVHVRVLSIKLILQLLNLLCNCIFSLSILFLNPNQTISETANHSTQQLFLFLLELLFCQFFSAINLLTVSLCLQASWLCFRFMSGILV